MITSHYGCEHGGYRVIERIDTPQGAFYGCGWLPLRRYRNVLLYDIWRKPGTIGTSDRYRDSEGQLWKQARKGWRQAPP